MDNGYGRGTGVPGHFWVNQACPLHGRKPVTDLDHHDEIEEKPGD